MYEENVEDWRVDMGPELKNIKLCNKETINEYIGWIRISNPKPQTSNTR